MKRLKPQGPGSITVGEDRVHKEVDLKVRQLRGRLYRDEAKVYDMEQPERNKLEQLKLKADGMVRERVGRY